MDNLVKFLNWGPISRVRRNHALEHGTLKILAARQPAQNRPAHLAGYSDEKGFWIFGTLSTDEVVSAAEQARQRLLGGDDSLAVHPTCGTNYVVSGIFAGTLVWLATLFGDRSFRARLERLPAIIALVTLGLVAAAPVGPMMQKAVTTQAQLGELEISGVLRHVRQGMVVHRVLTKG
jgi:hypothetical protein